MAVLSIVPATTFTAPAEIRVPGAAPVSVSVTWRHKGRRDYDAWWASVAGRDDVEVLSEIIAGWGSEIDAPYSRESLAAVLDAYPSAALDFFAAYREGLLGGRRKN